MGAFNTLFVNTNCPVCNQKTAFDIQFKYGNTWQFEYHTGDKISWGGNYIGLPNKKKVIVEGISGPCSNCGTDFLEFDIILESDVIKEAVALKKKRKNSMPEGYLVVAD
jgi:hypothetical protein